LVEIRTLRLACCPTQLLPGPHLMNLALTRLAVAGMVLAGMGSATADVDYVRDVKPMLAKHCVSCHGAARPRGGLRLDTATAAIKGGKSGPCVLPGNAAESPLIEAVLGEGTSERMPLKRPPLPEAAIAALRQWIEQGAKAPANEAPSVSESAHWAFSPPTRSTPPDVSAPAWVMNPIDRFILARLDRESLKPSIDADRRTLIRRVSLDLTGLPPTPDDVDAFVADTSPDAYERLVDRLLASSRFGERWARPWLDLARYADSNGYSIDAPRTIWRYRDWVISALNADQPFDQFLTDQLAGDLRPNASMDQRVATGFHRNTQINQEGGIDLEQFRVEAVVDRVNTTGTAFLGLSIGCAQCHDHKYDPISQREYYAFYAFFNNVDEPEIEFATPEQLAQREEVRREIIAFHAKLKADHPEIASKEREWEKTLPSEFTSALPPELKNAFDRPIEKRTESQWRGLTELYLEQSAEYRDIHKAIAALRKKEPKLSTSLVVQERSKPRETFIQIQGDFTRKGKLVSADVPSLLPPLRPSDPKQPTRLDLARSLVDPAHPLTARVTANRLWQAYFGRGLVETENDFGTQGSPPSHPELLDWLATELIAQRWSLKAMHRLIVTSRTYRQSSNSRADLDRLDPGNRLLARQSRLRLDAEMIRDSALSVSGLIAEKLGGPSVHPPQPEGVMALGQIKRSWIVSPGEDRYRRGLYTFFYRATPYPALTVFDAPNAMQSCTRRNRSNTPLQALTLLNDEAFIECARRLAAQVVEDGGTADSERIDLLFRRALGRGAVEREKAALAALLESERAEARGLSTPKRELAAWIAGARVLLNTDEFITRE
jgi:mono/diheme cytochrome c family protein